MTPISKTPNVGDVLTYRNRSRGLVLPVKVLKVSAAACVVEILAGGLRDSLKGGTLRAHVSMLYK